MESLLHYVETGVKEGAKLIFGGKRLDRKGWFLKIVIYFYFLDNFCVTLCRKLTRKPKMF